MSSGEQKEPFRSSLNEPQQEEDSPNEPAIMDLNNQQEFREIVDDIISSVSSNEEQDSSNMTSNSNEQATSSSYSDEPSNLETSEQHFVQMETMVPNDQTQFIELSSMSLTEGSSNEQEFCELSSMELGEEQQQYHELSNVGASTSQQYYEMSNMETGEQEFCIIESVEADLESAHSQEKDYHELSSIDHDDDPSNMTIIEEHELHEESEMSFAEQSSSNMDSSENLEGSNMSFNEQEQEPSNGQDDSGNKRMRRANITERQKYLMEFLHTENGLTAEEIRQHKSLIRADGTKILLKTVKYWLERLKKTGEMKTMHRSGRPRFLDDNREKELISYIDNNSKKNYHVIKRNIHLTCTRRTVNNYALRNGISK